jgi:transcriptional regulator with XRE-family HTH domain
VTAVQAKSPLREWREAAGFSLTDCAGLTGFSTAMFSRAERGERIFSPQAKVLIARRLGVSVAELFPVEDAEVSA